MREEKKHTKEEKTYTQKARNREMDDEEKQTARKGRLCYHGVQRKTSCLQPIHQLPATKFCVSHSVFSSPPLSFAFCLYPSICHKSGCSRSVSCEKMMELTFYWQKIYIHYSSINTLPLHASIQPLSHSLNFTILAVCECVCVR